MAVAGVLGAILIAAKFTAIGHWLPQLGIA
jgi:hypothetical protein